ncbi:hypothetical protein ABZX30_03655 [Streptomyces sp. NPDC004542]|uniref:hypothetical protein n=1 Tax=Streptomyces sp. NPDC004542 TaxID=3154281 RepID=UPI0033A5A11E
MGRGLVVAAVLTAVTAVACGAGGGKDVVVGGTPPATPYSGPLNAAADALECDGKVFDSAESDGWSRHDGGGTPEEGLKAYFDIYLPEVPRSGYRVEREEGDRVLYSYDVGGRTKVAVVVAENRRNRPGWGPETSASCDPAELPASVTDSWDVEIWTDRTGRRVPVTKVSSSAGAEHCDWQSVHFLQLGRGKGAATYVRDPDGLFTAGAQLSAPYDGDVRMPAGAHDTGYRYRGRQLWLTHDKAKAYVRTPHGVEAWPLAENGLACQ